MIFIVGTIRLRQSKSPAIKNSVKTLHILRSRLQFPTNSFLIQKSAWAVRTPPSAGERIDIGTALQGVTRLGQKVLPVLQSRAHQLNDPSKQHTVFPEMGWLPL
jgi:hypothetical protein